MSKDECDDHIEHDEHGVDDQDPRHGEVEGDRERSQEELQEVLVRVGAAEQCEFLSPCLFGVDAWFLGMGGVAGFLHVEFLLHFESGQVFEVVVLEFVNVVSVVAVVACLGNEQDL